MKKYQSLLLQKPLPQVLNTRALNAVNGFDAEMLAASRLLLACGGEIRWGSRTEEGNKIDLILSIEHPWYPAERLQLMVQVKSGPKYGRIKAPGFTLYGEAKKLTKRISKPMLVIWVDRESKATFWAYVHPNTLGGVQDYGKDHLISPPMRYDMARCEGNLYNPLKGGVGLTLSLKGGTLKEKRTAAEIAYQSLQKVGCFSSSLGRIQVSRVGWRHMFRKRRILAFKESSFAVIRKLDKLLAHEPSSIYSFTHPEIPQGDYVIRHTDYVLGYEECLFYDRTLHQNLPVKVVVRLIEEIRYPRNWAAEGIFSQKVQRTVTLGSCYFKKKETVPPVSAN